MAYCLTTFQVLLASVLLNCSALGWKTHVFACLLRSLQAVLTETTAVLIVTLLPCKPSQRLSCWTCVFTTVLSLPVAWRTFWSFIV